MKALSLKQPFAELILQGRKKIELRNWNTHFRGKFLIHASKNPDIKSMKKFSFAESSLPLGCIVGSAELKEVKHYKSSKEHAQDKGLHLADENWGNFGFILANPQRINPVIPAKGMLNFWEFKQK